MINRPQIVMLLFCLLGMSLTLNGQTEDKPILVNVETLERDFNKPKEKPKTAKPSSKKLSNDFFRHHKKLPKTYEGYAIELTTSDFPLSRDYHLFEQFGQVFYDKVEGQGYAYMIIADFSSKKSLEQYVQNVVIHKTSEARIVEYKKGKRLISEIKN